MNAFDKINPETADLLEGEVIIEAPKAPAKPDVPVRDPRLAEGVEVVRATMHYGSCQYYIEASNQDGTHAGRQNVGGIIESKWKGAAGHNNVAFFLARYSGSYSSGFEFIDAAPADLHF